MLTTTPIRVSGGIPPNITHLTTCKQCGKQVMKVKIEESCSLFCSDCTHAKLPNCTQCKTKCSKVGNTLCDKCHNSKQFNCCKECSTKCTKPYVNLCTKCHTNLKKAGKANSNSNSNSRSTRNNTNEKKPM